MGVTAGEKGREAEGIWKTVYYVPWTLRFELDGDKKGKGDACRRRFKEGPSEEGMSGM